MRRGGAARTGSGVCVCVCLAEHAPSPLAPSADLLLISPPPPSPCSSNSPLPSPLTLLPRSYTSALGVGLIPRGSQCRGEPHVRQFGEDMVKGLGLTPRTKASCDEVREGEKEGGLSLSLSVALCCLCLLLLPRELSARAASL